MDGAAYIPTARDQLAVAALDGRLDAVGGRIDGNYSRNLAANEAIPFAINSLCRLFFLVCRVMQDRYR